MGIEPEHKKTLDNYVKLGRYIVVLCIFNELMILPQVTSQFYMIYAGASPRIEQCGNHTIAPELEDKEACYIYEKYNCNVTELSHQFYSVNADWRYFCNTTKSVKNSISMQMFGVLAGSVVFGQLSDTFGRKISMLISIVGMAIGCVTVAHSRNLLQFTVTRTIVGFFTGGSISVSNVFIMENVPKKHRMWINMAITWSPNFPVVALIAYYSETWNRMAYANALICIPALLFCLLFVNESPRWLITKGRVEEARRNMQRQLKMSNQLYLMDDEFETVLRDEYKRAIEANAKKRQYSYYHLFCTRKLAFITSLLAFTFCSTSIINYGILFNMEKVSGSIYWNSVYTGLMRYICNLSFGYADLKLKFVGRKFIHSSGLVVILFSLGLVVFAYATGLNHTLHNETRIAILLASSMTSQIYIASGIIGTELFPTPIRNLGFSFLQLWNRVGVVMSPFVFYLQDYWIGYPYCVMFIFACIDLFAFEYGLPETKGRPMVDHMPPNHERFFYKRKSTEQSQQTQALVADA